MNNRECMDVLGQMLCYICDNQPNGANSIDAEALTHAIEHMKRGQWRPIESAPRDGTRVLLLMSCNKQCVARTEYHPFNGPQWVIYGEMGRPDCWALAVDDNDTNPTHWKPLDEPPQEGKD